MNYDQLRKAEREQDFGRWKQANSDKAVVSSGLLCCTCRHWTRDDELMGHLLLNFSVGKCALGRSISHGITRGHDTCEQHNA